MACPYLESIEDGDMNDNHNNIQANMTMNCNQQSTTDEESKKNELLNYTTYLRTDPLLNALKCLSRIDPSDESSSHVHDEHFFILIHQG